MTRRELDPWVEGYLGYLRDVRRLQPRTIIDLRCTLKKVSAFMTAAHPDTPLWKLTLEDYLHWLNAARAAGQAEIALAKELSHLRGLLDYAWRSGRADRNVLDGFSLHDNLRRIEPRSLTLAEAERLVQACPRQTIADRRDRLVVLLLYGCGLRTAELCGLDVRDVDVERRELFVRHGKGDRQRTIPVPAAVWTELLAYLLEQGHKRGAVFRTACRGARLKLEDAGNIVRAAAKAAGLPGKVTPRTLRHTFGTHLMDAGVDLGVIASLMGHRSPTETGVYLHVLPGKPQAAVATLVRNGEEDEP
jgi:site-specific recombinase XerD